MNLFRRPWLNPERLEEDLVAPLGPEDCFLAEGNKNSVRPSLEHTVLMGWRVDQRQRVLRLLPYPKTGRTKGSPEVAGLPFRPKPNLEPKTELEEKSIAALGRMNRVLARIQELDAALDDPENLWSRLSDAWKRAENEEDPRMAEIVRQAKNIMPRVQELERRMRRVLRRTRELTPLDRVQEMDRASMLWLVRQPGQTTAERAGTRQRVLATVRHENFDTLENRVLHAYTDLASDSAREWLREHPGAKYSQRYAQVEKYRRYARRVSRMLDELGVAKAEPGITPNYVLLDDRDYHAVYGAWKRLLRDEFVIDDLWSWQAQSWTDFCILAITLSLFKMEEAELVTQSPIIWHSEAVNGRWFEQDNPLAVFWLKDTGRIVEVQARPKGVSTHQAATRAYVWLRIHDLEGESLPRRVAVWTPHTFDPMNIEYETEKAADLLLTTRRIARNEVLNDGLILAQAIESAEQTSAAQGDILVQGIILGAAGQQLAGGMDFIANFVRKTVLRERA